jgi:hypothetical protein
MAYEPPPMDMLMHATKTLPSSIQHNQPYQPVRYATLPLDELHNEQTAHGSVYPAVGKQSSFPEGQMEVPSSRGKHHKLVKKRASLGNKRSFPVDTCKRKRFEMSDDSDDEDYKPPPWVKIPNYSTMKASTSLFFPSK